LPAWFLYVGTALAALYAVDRRAYALESRRAPAHPATRPLRVRGVPNLGLMAVVVPSALLPLGLRELAMGVISMASLLTTPRALQRSNGFTLAPLTEVAIVFAGLFACLGPVQVALAGAAPSLPLRHGWQLFWATGIVSSVLDNAPTYAAFAAVARGASASSVALVAGIAPIKLAAVSIGAVVMGATTYIGNGPNLMVKAIAERARFPTPTFLRYALFAFAVMLPAHVVTTVVLVLLDR
jgi:Na+/H+ antiporter NhaD/arsenite permease-like protein